MYKQKNTYKKKHKKNKQNKKPKKYTNKQIKQKQK